MTGSLAPATSNRRIVGTALSLATTGILPVFLTGAVAVQMSSELGYGTPGIGLAIAAFYMAATVVSVSLGRLADRIGWPRAFVLGGGGCVVALVALAIAGRSLATVVLLLAVGGIANALLQPAVNLFLARLAPTERRGLMFGLKQAAIPMATLVGGLSVPVVALTLGWRWAFGLAAMLGVVALATAPWQARDVVPAPQGGPIARAPDRDGTLRLLTVVTLLGQTGASVLGSFVVVAAVHVGVGDGAAGLLLAAASVIGIVSRVAIGWWADRRRPMPGLEVIAVMLGIGAVGLAITAIPRPAAIVVGSVVAFATAWGWPGLFNLIVVTRYHHRPATATSVTQAGVYLGNGIGPLLFGVIAAWSYIAAWLVSAVMLAIAATLAWFVEQATRTEEAT